MGIETPTIWLMSLSPIMWIYMDIMGVDRPDRTYELGYTYHTLSNAPERNLPPRGGCGLAMSFFASAKCSGT